MTVIQSDSRLEAACDSPDAPEAATTARARRSGTLTTRNSWPCKGAALTDPEARADLGQVPAHEQVVLLPRAILEGYGRTRP